MISSATTTLHTTATPFLHNRKQFKNQNSPSEAKKRLTSSLIIILHSYTTYYRNTVSTQQKTVHKFQQVIRNRTRLTSSLKISSSTTTLHTNATPFLHNRKRFTNSNSPSEIKPISFITYNFIIYNYTTRSICLGSKGLV